MEQELIDLIKSCENSSIPSCNFVRLRQILSTPEGRGLVNTINIDGMSSVRYVLSKPGGCCTLLLKLLIKAGANINSQRENTLPPIFYAVFYNNMDGLIELIKAGANVNTIINNDNQTTLMSAVANGREIAVKELIKAGANVNFQDIHRKRALDYCDSMYMLDTYDILVEAGAVFGDIARLSDKKGVMEKHVKIKRELLEKELEYTEAGKDIDTPLINAIVNNNVEIFNKLIRQSVNVNLPQYDGMTPLIYAVLYDKPEMVNRLIEKGADLNIQSYYGYTALMVASRNSGLSIIFDLLGAGADPFVTNKFGDTALDRAIFFKRERPIIDALKRVMELTSLNTANAYLRSRSDTSGLGPSVETPLRGFSQNVWGDDFLMEQILNMAYGEDEEKENKGAEESKSNRGDAGGRRRKSNRRKKSVSKKRKSNRRKKSVSKRKSNRRKKSN